MADQKLTDLTAVTSPAKTDLAYLVVDPGGSPLDRKVTIENLLKTVSDLTADTTPTTDDLVLTINDPAGTPVPKKVTLANLLGLQTQVLISEVTTTGSQATVSFTSIPNTYRDLLVVVRGRGNAVATAVITRVRFNGDTAANYDYAKFDADGGASGGGSGGQGNAQTSADFGYISGSSAPASRSSSCSLHIYDYKGTTFTKTGRSIGTLVTADSAGGYFTTNGTIGWRSASAITQVDVLLSSSTFTDGTVVSLYGIR